MFRAIGRLVAASVTSVVRCLIRAFLLVTCLHSDREYVRVANLTRWRFSNLSNSLFDARVPRRRLLMVYDLTTQPYSIGDILLFQEASLVLREQHSLDLVDFALADDPSLPRADPSLAGINGANNLLFLAGVLQAAQVNPHLGSLLYFDSHLGLKRYIMDNADICFVWPPGENFCSREYLYYRILNELFFEWHSSHGALPVLSGRKVLVDWARNFNHDHVYPLVPVTVQLRNNKQFHQERNLDPGVWNEFFDHCSGRYPAKFVILCAPGEIDARFRDCANVVIAKDYHTSIEQDLALVQAAEIHIGTSSGPGTMAWFNTKPYFMVRSMIQEHLYRGMIREDGFLRFFWSSPLQRFTNSGESVELLMSEFSRMWESAALDTWTPWEAMGPGKDKEPLTWLR